jgi:hypothetical protein
MIDGSFVKKMQIVGWRGLTSLYVLWEVVKVTVERGMVLLYGGRKK